MILYPSSRTSPIMLWWALVSSDHSSCWNSRQEIKYSVGQRYHVVVDALAQHVNDDTQEYWIRTIPAKDCSNFELGGVPDERQGILYYGKHRSAYPTTPRGNFSIDCRDEDPKKLSPILPWRVQKPKAVGRFCFLLNENYNWILLIMKLHRNKA